MIINHDLFRTTAGIIFTLHETISIYKLRMISTKLQSIKNVLDIQMTCMLPLSVLPCMAMINTDQRANTSSKSFLFLWWNWWYWALVNAIRRFVNMESAWPIMERWQFDKNKHYRVLFNSSNGDVLVLDIISSYDVVVVFRGLNVTT